MRIENPTSYSFMGFDVFFSHRKQVVVGFCDVYVARLKAHLVAKG